MAMIRRTAQEQIQLIGECRASGLTIAEWCLREGIKPDTYYSWVDRQSKKGRIEKVQSDRETGQQRHISRSGQDGIGGHKLT